MDLTIFSMVKYWHDMGGDLCMCADPRLMPHLLLLLLYITEIIDISARKPGGPVRVIPRIDVHAHWKILNKQDHISILKWTRINRNKTMEGNRNGIYSTLMGSMSNGYAHKMIESSFKNQKPTDKMQGIQQSGDAMPLHIRPCSSKSWRRRASSNFGCWQKFKM